MIYKFDPERIAYWFFRLNGCFIVENLLIHHPQRGYEGTDIDILAMRFPYRRELASSALLTAPPMEDHCLFMSGIDDRLIDIYLVEVKRGKMRLNSSWENLENLQRLLHAIGAYPERNVIVVSKELLRNYSYADDHFRIRYVAIGEYGEEELPKAVARLRWDNVLGFIYDRLHGYRNQKVQHRQWGRTGRNLYALAQQSARSSDAKNLYIKKVMDAMSKE